MQYLSNSRRELSNSRYHNYMQGSKGSKTWVTGIVRKCPWSLVLQLVYALYSWLFLFLAITCFITCYNLLNPKSCRYFLQFLCPAVHWNKARRFYSGKRKGSQFSSISSYSHIYSFVPSADAEFSSLTNPCTMMSWSWRFYILYHV